MNVSDLRIALFSANYNYVRDGANQALNRLVAYLLSKGAAVRIYSPVVDKPALPPMGDIVNVPAWPIPGRSEYRIPVMLSSAVKRDIINFRPNIFHVASPDFVGHRAVTLARELGIPAVASVHTRFETYPRYYGLAFMEPVIEAILRRFYRRCDAIFPPSESTARILRKQKMSRDVGIWTRGVDREIFNPGRRDLSWRHELGIADDMPVIGFVGRLVMEKGLDVFSATIAQLEKRKVRHRVLVVGDGPARAWFEKAMPNGIFTGFQQGSDLGRAIASMDIFFNPSVTEAFGNVTLEAMAASLPIVAAIATGSQSLVTDGKTGRLIRAGAIDAFADALVFYCENENERRKAGKAGLQTSTQYGWDEVNQALVDAYIHIINKRTETARSKPTPIS